MSRCRPAASKRNGTSTRPHARFVLGGPTGARGGNSNLYCRKSFPGLSGVVTAEDIPSTGQVLIGLGLDDPVFCRDVVTHVGAPVVSGRGGRRHIAKRAADYIQNGSALQYEDLPAIPTLEEAIAAGSIMPNESPTDPDQRPPRHGDPRQGATPTWLPDRSSRCPGRRWSRATIQTGPGALLPRRRSAPGHPRHVRPDDGHSSTQNPNGDQAKIARVLASRPTR